MTIITAVQKADEVAIACDTQISSSNSGLMLLAEYQVNASKLISYGDSILGISGSCAVMRIFEDFLDRSEPAHLGSRTDVFRWLLAQQDTLKSDYYMKTDNGNDKSQPTESQWLTAMLINPHGIFSINPYRQVNEYSKFWAVGSGCRFALGALEILYKQPLTATEIAREAALVATKFNPGCSEPVFVQTIQKQPAPGTAPSE